METRILTALAKFIAANKLSKWGKAEHNQFLAAVLAKLPQDEWLAALDVLGLGGNCSAFGKAMSARNEDVNSAFYGKLMTLKSESAKLATLLAGLDEV